MRILLVGSFVLASSAAHAERATTVSVGAMVGGAERQVDESVQMKATGGPRIVLSWEHAPVPLPPTKGVAVDFSMVPELTAGALLNEERGEVMVGVGARAELRMAQRDGGALKINARFAVYAAARVMVVGDNQDTAIEGALGEYVYLKGRLRLGGEIGLLNREQTTTNDASSREMGVFASVYLGWAM